MKRRRQRRSGASAIELALTLPILFFILFAAYESARANLLRHAARSAAYEGARVGIVPGVSAQDVEDTANAILATIGIRNADVTITPTQIQESSPTVRVDVAIDAEDNFFFAPFFFRDAVFAGDCELSREVLN